MANRTKKKMGIKKPANIWRRTAKLGISEATLVCNTCFKDTGHTHTKNEKKRKKREGRF